MKNSTMSSYKHVLKERDYKDSMDDERNRRKNKDRNSNSKHSSHSHKNKRSNSPHRSSRHKKSPLKSKFGNDNSDHHRSRKHHESEINESYEELSRRKRKLESELRALDLEEAAEREAENKKARKEKSDRKEAPDAKRRRPSSRSDDDSDRKEVPDARRRRPSSRSDDDSDRKEIPDARRQPSSRSDDDSERKVHNARRQPSSRSDDDSERKVHNARKRPSSRSDDDNERKVHNARRRPSSRSDDDSDRKELSNTRRQPTSRTGDDRKLSKNKAQNVTVKVEKEKHKSEASKSSENEQNWGKPQQEAKDLNKEKPNFEVSGKLAEETNTYNGVVIKYNEPAEARKPKRKWRLYPFKGESDLPYIPIHRQSAYLFGRTRLIADIPIDHPSCSKQHAVLQYRLVPYKREDGTTGRRVRPYIIDLESSNGTFVNNQKINPRCYVELVEKDVIKFGYSSREYVLLHEGSKNDEEDDDVLETND